MFATSKQEPQPRPLTHEERLALINKPFPIVKGKSQFHANTHGFKAWNLSQRDKEQEAW